MMRVYFDWVVFTRLNQKKENEEPYKTIFSIVERNRNNLLFPYSPSHLNDLKRGFNNSEKANKYTYEDLEFLQKLSQDHCLYEDTKQKKVIPSVHNPTEYFNQLKDDTTLTDFDIDNLFGTDKNDQLSKLWSSYMDLLKAIPSGIDLQEIEKMPAKYGTLKTVLKNTKNENNFYNLLKDMIQVLSVPEQHSEVYTSTRNSSIEDMKIDTNPKNWGNAFEYLDKVVAKTKLNTSFREMVEKNLKLTNKDKEPARFDYFINYFISLDTYGYYRDKKLSNLIDDAMHAYYGAFCDFFITDDNNTYQKAKALYEHLNIETTVCSSQEFPAVFYSKNYLNNDDYKTTLTDRITEIIQNSVVLLNTIDDELNPVTVHKISVPLVEYFTRMQISSYNDSTVLTFYKKRDNYSDFMFWTELKTVINKIVAEFGADDNLRGDFNEDKEKDELLANKWQGRAWSFNKKVMSDLVYNDSPFGLTLRLTIKKLNMN